MSDMEQDQPPAQMTAPAPPPQAAARGAIKETYEDTRYAPSESSAPSFLSMTRLSPSVACLLMIRRVIRELITGLTPRAQSDLGFIEKTAAMMQRMDASRTAELSKLADEEKRALSFITYLSHVL